MLARLSFIFGLLSAAPAFSQSFIGQPVSGSSQGGYTTIVPSFFGGDAFANANPIAIASEAPFSGTACGAVGLSGQDCFGQIVIPLSDFATAQSVQQLQASLGASASASSANAAAIANLTSQFNSFVSDQEAINAHLAQANLRLGRGVAMASSLALEGPLDGKANRLAIGVGAYGNSNAISVNYSHRSGQYDFGVAASFAGGSAIGKADLGFSW